MDLSSFSAGKFIALFPRGELSRRQSDAREFPPESQDLPGLGVLVVLI